MRISGWLKRICGVKLKGSYTLEAALLFPLIMMILVFLLFFTFFLYNRLALQTCVIRGSKQVHYYHTGSNAEIQKECGRVARACIKEELVAVCDSNVTIAVSHSGVTAEATAVQNVVYLWPKEMLGEDFFALRESWETSGISEEEIFREVRKYILYWELIQDYADGQKEEGEPE